MAEILVIHEGIDSHLTYQIRSSPTSPFLKRPPRKPLGKAKSVGRIFDWWFIIELGRILFGLVQNHYNNGIGVKITESDEKAGLRLL